MKYIGERITKKAISALNTYRPTNPSELKSKVGIGVPISVSTPSYQCLTAITTFSSHEIGQPPDAQSTCSLETLSATTVED